ncbi:ImmA/IrrE family metallo-endopeptidase [Brachybacterium tyrofermentans]|uniref:ImmA/IrrE family metallo-endopeptidase n=1 Tax=Brachybacterium tyrofermentans TaxID=47848 RepID=UPI0021F80D62|nr:ImmA/IrrE family metallo-endopeptidase [Brachybacterium tyrofermentans]
MTSLPDTSPDLTRLVEHAHESGIRVWWRHLDDCDGAWSAPHRSIWMRPDLTSRESRSLLAHELGHAYYGDSGPQSSAAESRAWRYAAWLLIDGHAYSDAEHTMGPHLGGLAEALDVTTSVVEGFRSLIGSAP